MPRRSSPEREKLLVGFAGFILLLGLIFAFRPVQFHPVPAAPKAVSPKAVTPESAVPPPVARPMAFPRGRGRIAIVLDDWGYSLHQVPTLSRLRSPLTVAVLPGHPFSTKVAQTAREAGHEVILHMPMEALDPEAPREAATILTQMPKEEVRRRLKESLRSVPFVQGMNNHQGSKATMDRSLMRVVLSELKRRRLYFLDSFVTEASVCDRVAREMKLKFARRSVFLDNDKNPSAIRERLLTLVQAAAREGQAIGIGHDRPATLKVLEEAIPALEQAGYQLVAVSELAK